jgi:uncharacterized protein involved in exopolysaccharide biosynthesis
MHTGNATRDRTRTFQTTVTTMLTSNKTQLLEQEDDLGDAMDFRRVFVQLVAKRWWVAASVIGFGAACAAIEFLSTPTYRAVVVMEPTVTERGADIMGLGSSQLGGLASIAGLALGPKDAETEEAIAVLESREFTDKFIASKQLMPKLFASKWNSVTGTWKVGPAKQPTQSRAYKFFQQIRSVVRDRKAGLVTLEIDWRDREEAAQWANELVMLLNLEMRSRAIARADASMSFLQKELQTTTTVEGRGAISRLMETQLKQRMLANVTPDYSFRVIDRAVPADRDDPVWPRKRVLLVGGPFSGLIFGVVVALYFGPSRARRSEYSKSARLSREVAVARPCDS